MDDTNTNNSSTSTITAKIASSKFRLARIEMSRSLEFLQSQIERGTHISSLKILAQKTEDRLEQMKVIATEVFANGSSEDNDDAMEICACLSRQLLELTYNVNTLSEDLTSCSGSNTINVIKSTPVSGRNPFVKDTYAKNHFTQPSSNRVNNSSDEEPINLQNDMLLHQHSTTDVPQISLNHSANQSLSRELTSLSSQSSLEQKKFTGFEQIIQPTNQLLLTSVQQAVPDNLHLNRSHDSFQFSAPAVHANLHEKFSLESSFAYSNRQQPGNVIQTSTSKENIFHLTHQKSLEQYTSPPTVIQANRNPFAQNHSVEQFQRTLDLNNQVVDRHGDIKKHQVVDGHGYDKNQVNILHAHHCHEPVFTNNPISTHCEQNRDALTENHSRYLIHPNYNQTPPHLLVQSLSFNQIMDTHGSKRSETNNIQPQHKFHQVVNYPISSNSEQNRDAFRENYSLYTNNANYNQPRPFPTVQNHPYNQITDTHVGNS